MIDLEIINGDINFANGQPVVISDEQKLVQSLVKILVTPLRATSVRPGYGTYLTNILGHANIPDHIYLTKIRDAIEDAINNLMRQQAEASKRQYVSGGERIRNLLYVDVVRDPVDQRQLDIYIGVKAGSGSIIEKQFVIAPGQYVTEAYMKTTPSVGAGGY